MSRSLTMPSTLGSVVAHDDGADAMLGQQVEESGDTGVGAHRDDGVSLALHDIGDPHALTVVPRADPRQTSAGLTPRPPTVHGAARRVTGADGIRHAGRTAPHRCRAGFSLYNGSSGTFLPVKEGNDAMATVKFDEATRIYPGNDSPSVDRLNIDVAGRRVPRPRRSLGLRQVHRAAHAGRPRRGQRRQDLDR